MVNQGILQRCYWESSMEIHKGYMHLEKRNKGLVTNITWGYKVIPRIPCFHE